MFQLHLEYQCRPTSGRTGGGRQRAIYNTLPAPNLPDFNGILISTHVRWSQSVTLEQISVEIRPSVQFSHSSLEGRAESNEMLKKRQQFNDNNT